MRYLLLSLEGGAKRWIVSSIWDDIRVFRHVEELRNDAKVYGDKKAKFTIVDEDAYYSGKFIPLKPPKNLSELIAKIELNKPLPRVAAPEPAPLTDFEKWLGTDRKD